MPLVITTCAVCLVLGAQQDESDIAVNKDFMGNGEILVFEGLGGSRLIYKCLLSFFSGLESIALKVL